MNHYDEALNNMTIANGASNDVAEYEFLSAAIKHLEKRKDELKKRAKAGEATPDMQRLKELRATTTQVTRYSMDAIKERFGEDNLAFALSFSSQTSVRVCNIPNELEKAA